MRPQALVFCLLMYQHFSGWRLLLLLAGGAAVVMGNRWAPALRDAVAQRLRPAAEAGAGGGGAPGVAQGRHGQPALPARPRRAVATRLQVLP